MFKKIVFLFGLYLLLAAPVFAAVGDLVIRLEEPKTPTNQNDFPITFVVLDLVGGRNISVVCNKQYEGGATTTYDSHTLSAGGNTDSCHVTSDVIKDKGSYLFSVIATAGSDSTSDAVTVIYNNDSPGDPRNYSKNKISGCTYEIKFTSAEDNGKTVKVEVYRSTDTSFTADNGSRVAEEWMGSNTDRTIHNDVPDCNKTYYYAVRAFSGSGAGSGLVGDQEIKWINSTTTTSTTQAGGQGAIPVRRGTISGIEENVKDASPATSASESGTILGQENEAEKPNQGSLLSRLAQISPVIWVILGLITLIGVARLISRFRTE